MNGGKAWKHHGFDVSKFCPSSLFYAPCRAEEANATFFRDYRNRARKSLNVLEWIESDCQKAPHDPAETTPINANRQDTAENAPISLAKMPPQDEEVMTAIAAWREAIPGSGHYAFFKFACALKRAEMSLNEIACLLSSEAKNARSPRDRRAEIPNILEKLSRGERSRSVG
jgi:hypothetical protein